MMIYIVAYSCDEDIPHLKAILYMEGAPYVPVYKVICEPGYLLNINQTYIECRDGIWIPRKPECVKLIDSMITAARVSGKTINNHHPEIK